MATMSLGEILTAMAERMDWQGDPGKRADVLDSIAVLDTDDDVPVPFVLASEEDDADDADVKVDGALA